MLSFAHQNKLEYENEIDKNEIFDQLIFRLLDYHHKFVYQNRQFMIHLVHQHQMSYAHQLLK